MAGFRLYTEQIEFKAWRDDLTISAFHEALKNHPLNPSTTTTTTATTTRRRNGKRLHHRSVRLRHHLKEDYYVVPIDNQVQEILVETKESLLGEALVAEATPPLILSAMLKFQLSKKKIKNSREKWRNCVLESVMNKIKEVDHPPQPHPNPGHHHDHVLITVDIISHRSYRCFEEVAESTKL